MSARVRGSFPKKPPAEMPTPTLATALSVYTYPFLTKEATKWVQECYGSRLTEIQREARLVVPEGQDEQATKDALRYRAPVYFGRHVTSCYSEALLRSVHGYDLQAVNKVITPPSGQRRAQFAIVAPNWSSSDPTKFHTIHAFGVNLESRGTPDYKCMIDPSTKAFNVERYTAAVSLLLRLIVGGAKSVAHAQSINAPVVRMPLIGLGAFLSAVGTAERDAAKDAFVCALALVAPQVKEANMTLQVLDFEGDTLALPDEQALARQGVHLLRGREEGNLFGIAPSTDLFLVNAWDDVSFVGNGGSKDPTIDGFMVAGWGPGQRLVNCSYLHNPFFLPELSNPSAWLRI